MPITKLGTRAAVCASIDQHPSLRTASFQPTCCPRKAPFAALPALLGPCAPGRTCRELVAVDEHTYTYLHLVDLAVLQW